MCVVPDAIFAEPRLAAVYDAFDDDRTDLDAYVRIVTELGASSVLDVGCGTGSLAVRLARAGCTVTGIDPAAASLDVARTKPGAQSVTWILAGAAAAPPLGVDLAVLTGNVAQVLRTEEEWTAALGAVRGALRPGGHLVFETRRPERRAWEEWAADTGPRVRHVPGIGAVEQRSEVTAVTLPLVRFRQTYRFAADGVVLTSESTLRFRSREEIEQALAATGFTVLDVREAPDRPGREFVFVARRAG